MNRAAAVLSLFLCVVIAADSLLAPAYAQSPQPGIILVQDQQGPGIFRFLFRNDRRRQEQPQILRRLTPREERQQLRPRTREAARPRQEREAARPGREKREAARPRREKREAARSREAAPQPQRKRRERRPAVPAPREVVAVEKVENAKRVLVLGDFMAGALSKGLTEAYAENPNIVVIDGANGASGLVRADVHDWPGQLPALMETHKPDALLMVVGANDRQSIDTETGAQALGSPGWRAAYAARVAALAEALKATGKPVLWAGLAPVRSSAMSRDYSAINDIVREQLEPKGLRFVETWNGFADEEGRFVASGPDIGGQNVQLRDSDGLNFTRAGQRKLAFFVEQELTGVLGSGGPQVAVVDPALSGTADPAIADPAMAGPRIGPMVPMEALSTGGDALSAGAASAEPSSGAVVSTISRRLAGEGAAVPPTGRVDAYAWPPRPLPVVTPAAVPPGAAPATPVVPLAGAAPALAPAAPGPPEPALSTP